MAPKRLIEFDTGPRRIRLPSRGNFLQHIRVAADGALPEDNHASGQNVGAFDGNADGNLLIGAAKIIVRPQADALAAMHVHRVVDDRAPAFGAMIFDDGGDHRGFFTQVDGAGGHGPRRVDRVGVRRQSGPAPLRRPRICRWES